jgi:kynurenine formamidase
MALQEGRPVRSADDERWSFELIDLSRPLTVETVDALFGDLVADGKNQYFRDLSVDVAVDYTQTNAYSCTLRIPDHVATHVDAPVHTVPGGAFLEGVDLRRLIGEAVCLDLDRGGIDYGYTADDLDEAGADVRPGDIVLIYSGFRDTPPGQLMRQTYLTPPAAEWLVEHGAVAVGLEPASPDPVRAGMYEYGWSDLDGPNPPPWPAHGILLRNDVYVIEGLTNLDRIRGRRVRFAALPPLIPGLSGCPVRAVAWVEGQSD